MENRALKAKDNITNVINGFHMIPKYVLQSELSEKEK